MNQRLRGRELDLVPLLDRFDPECDREVGLAHAGHPRRIRFSPLAIQSTALDSLYLLACLLLFLLFDRHKGAVILFLRIIY